MLRAEYTGGFVTPSVHWPAGSRWSASTPTAGCSREGPVAAIYPGPALPNVQVQQIDARRRAGARRPGAGRRRRGDHRPRHARRWPTRRPPGSPLVTASHTYVREVPALWRGTAGGQRAHRRPAGRPDGAERPPHRAAGPRRRAHSAPYAPTAVAALATPWADPQDGLAAAGRGLARPGAARASPPAGCRTSAA